MKRARVHECSAIKTHFDKNASVLATAKEPSTSTSSTNSGYTQNTTDANIYQQPASFNSNAPLRYADILTFIQGSLLVGSNDEGAVDGDINDNDMDDGEESGSVKQQCLNKIPTIYEIAKGER
eukprot:scaffold255_cov117-Skeletonema_dohrnii-CCMP3373.AAC.1